jgi:Mg2+-importing ATPase
VIDGFGRTGRVSEQLERFWGVPEAELHARLGTSATGLPTAEAARRLREVGPNEIAARRRGWAVTRLFSKLKNPLVLILLVASVVSSASGDIASTVIIGVVIVTSVLLDFVQEERAARTAEALRQSVALRTRVVRDGRDQTLPAAELVPGDLVRLAAGNLVPADGRVVEARDFFVNQAHLTGEPYPVEKRPGISAATQPADAENAVFLGSAVVSGAGSMLVCRTGAATELGGIAGALQRIERPTAFEQGIHAFGMLITRVTMVLVAAVLLVLALTGRPMLESVMFAVALAVGLTPELLPMIITVTLARGAMRLSRRRVIVKRLRAVQDLGALDVLCTDKTGTLTEAHIRLASAVDPTGAPSDRVLELAWLNAHFESGIQSPLDRAIVDAVTTPPAGWRKLDELPFDFERRRVSVLVDGPGGRLLVVKGAPEDVLAHSRWVGGDGDRVPLDAAEIGGVHARIDALGHAGLRALGVAWRTVPAGHAHCVIDDEEGLVFAGLLAFQDPPKPGAMEAIRALEDHGVDVKIVTGDSEPVTRHLCEAVGFPLRDVLCGADVDRLDDAALAARAEGTDAFCRVNPGQKARVIRALRERGHVVGYLGDGVNDAPSLHAADVGISVEGAVDVAREAATLLLLGHDLDVLLQGVREGRRTFGNVRKYIQMGTSSNFGNMASMAFAAAFLPFLPMRAEQILVNNLLYDLANLPIPLDEVDEEQLATPQRWDIAGVRRFMLLLGPVSSAFDLATFAFLYWGLHAGEPLFQTGWFVESLATQSLVIFVIRTRRLPWRSRPAPWLAAAACGVTGVAVLLPLSPLAAALRFVPPPPVYYLATTGFVVAYLACAEVMKRYFYRRFG